MFNLKHKLVKKWIKHTCGIFDYDFAVLYKYQMIVRPHYAYCMLNAAILAMRLGKTKISVIEFGVAGGNGLLAAEYLAEKIEKHLNGAIEFEIYGFDTGEGLPEPEGKEDLPYWFEANQYKMDVERLKGRLTRAKLILGNVKDTSEDFFKNNDPAPVGAMFYDMDYHSSTRDCFKLFDEDDIDRFFLPRLYLYMDDVIGMDIEMYSEFNGQLLAIKEFNERSDGIKIHLNQNLIPKSGFDAKYQIYYAHLFNHKLYSKFVGGTEKNISEQRLKLK